jgi:electron transfer flavoprotein-quinone oxidoreductase
MAKSFDVIIVGAGPAGSMAALKLARAGLEVALLERGTRPGAKNIFGGLLHNTPALNEIFPSLWEKAPLERHVHRKTLALMTPEASVAMSFETGSFEKAPYNGYTVMRPIFDNWLAEEAVREGATLLASCTAEDLIRENGRISGVTVKGRAGELRGNIVIAADGVLSFMAEKAGLRGEIKPGHMGLGVKLLLGLPREVINERFGLVRDEGADYSLLGITRGLRGGGFLYTNSESLSLGLVVHLDSLKASGQKPYDLLNQACQHPQLQKLLKGAVPLEYSAHLVPEGGLRGMPRLYTDGMMVVGDAAGLCYTNGFNLEGMNLALTSGALAAECALEAIKAKDYSARSLSRYQKRLGASFVIKDMRAFKKAVDMMHMERLYAAYPELVCGLLERIYRAEGKPRDRLLKLLRKEAAGRVKLRELLADAIRIGRAWL